MRQHFLSGIVAQQEFGGGVRPTQQNPVQDTKDVHFATPSKRKCCNFLPCSRLDKTLPYPVREWKGKKSNSIPGKLSFNPFTPELKKNILLTF